VDFSGKSSSPYKSADFSLRRLRLNSSRDNR
jgi:hypothetical protein